MACPQVAGLAALIASVQPEYTNQDVWDKMIISADTIPVTRDLQINSKTALDVAGANEEPEESLAVSSSEIQKGRISFTCRTRESTDYDLRIFDVTGREVYVKRGRIAPQGRIESNPVIPRCLLLGA